MSKHLYCKCLTRQASFAIFLSLSNWQIDVSQETSYWQPNVEKRRGSQDKDQRPEQPRRARQRSVTPKLWYLYNIPTSSRPHWRWLRTAFSGSRRLECNILGTAIKMFLLKPYWQHITRFVNVWSVFFLFYLIVSNISRSAGKGMFFVLFFVQKIRFPGNVLERVILCAVLRNHVLIQGASLSQPHLTWHRDCHLFMAQEAVS